MATPRVRPGRESLSVRLTLYDTGMKLACSRAHDLEGGRALLLTRYHSMGSGETRLTRTAQVMRACV
jgi:hypothetical protein